MHISVINALRTVYAFYSNFFVMLLLHMAFLFLIVVLATLAAAGVW